MTVTRLAAAIAVALSGHAANAADFEFSREWTFAHTATNSSLGLGSEIVSYDALNNRYWVVGGSGVDILDANGVLVSSINTTALGNANSVAISNNKVAVSFTAPVNTDPSIVRFFDATSYSVLGDVSVGATPDMVTFTPDGSKLLVANEAEPGAGYAPDPVGSISIIDVGTLTSTTASFTAYNGTEAALRAEGVRLNGFNTPTVAEDLEPEYIAISQDGSTAMVTLQEANSLARVDIATGTVVDIIPLGLKNHSLPGNRLDASDRDGAGNAALNGNLQNWNVFGMYMPDGISSFSQNGNQYYVTANEGDGREYLPAFVDEVRVGAATIDPKLDAILDVAHGVDWQTNNDKLNRLTVSTSGDTDGDGDLDQLQVYGGRSFSVLDANGNLVFDSGDEIEQIIKDLYPALWDDSRSDNKGPEPESAVVGRLNGTDLLFLGLERSNAVMIWDLTDLNNISFLDMLITAGDVGPEGLSFFTAGGQGFLAVANEVSRTTSLYSIAPVPVPAAVWLFASALGLLGVSRRRFA